MLRLFYKFPVSTNLLKFLKIEIEDDNDLGTIIAIYCSPEIDNLSPIELFAKIAEPKPIQVKIQEDQSSWGRSMPTPENPNTSGCSYYIPNTCTRLEIHPEYWHAYTASFVKQQSHLPRPFAVTLPRIGRLFTVYVYRMMIETYSKDGIKYASGGHVKYGISWVTKQQHILVARNLSRTLLYHLKPEPEFPLSFENIFGDDQELQHSTHSKSSLYHSELHRQAHKPAIEDIFPMVPLVTQYLLTLDDGAYDCTTFLSILDRTPDVKPSNYETPQQGARHHRRRQPYCYTPASETSSGSR
ncbi:hypothetical protein J1N35_028421 [Gossypium stocksii]|uniref:Uncharacterized protein n=1 Tax=Gossypium stocksii TaxID=47602 RepID=A0A9D3UWN1_9ROSI|nr:hypothetical protein J1N35_028421 [Gossypium stocksii]